MFSRRTLLAALALIPLAACGQSGGSAATPTVSTPAVSQAVVVYAPGALAATTKQISEAYAKTGQSVTFEVGHTPMQREQLAQGATPDVWIAANPALMESAAAANLVDKTAVKPLVTTKLMIIVAPGNPGKVSAVSDLAKPGLRLLVGADTLPIGTATNAFVDKAAAGEGADFKAKVTANTVSRELGVQPIVSKVTLGEADAGIVFVTDLGPDRKGVTTVDIPDELNQTLVMSIAPVSAGKNRAGADAFITFLTTGPGAQVLTAAGFLPAKG